MTAAHHYCTFFDRNYLVPGVALALSLRRQDPSSVIWTLCLDDETAAVVGRLSDLGMRAVPLAELEAGDPELAAAREGRTRAEYIFTLSPCLPLHLLECNPLVPSITYVDADMAFFSDPRSWWERLDRAEVLLVKHRFPDFLRHLEMFGKFNVGILGFRNDAEGRRCLASWRRQCLDWCRDVVEPGRFADQKYLDAWPEQFQNVAVCDHPGINLAPWNWMSHRYRFRGGSLLVDGQPLVAFHFARFRPIGGRWFDSGQLDYGVMPLRLRSWIYERYHGWLTEARARVAAIAPELARQRTGVRGRSVGWKRGLLRFVFGPVWLRVGPVWISGRLGIGRFSGRWLSWTRRRGRPEEAS